MIEDANKKKKKLVEDVKIKSKELKENFIKKIKKFKLYGSEVYALNVDE